MRQDFNTLNRRVQQLPLKKRIRFLVIAISKTIAIGLGVGVVSLVIMFSIMIALLRIGFHWPIVGPVTWCVLGCLVGAPLLCRILSPKRLLDWLESMER